MSTPTWTAPTEMGTTSIYARGWQARVFPGGIEHDAPERGFYLSTYKFDGRGGADAWYPTLEEAQAAGEAFVNAAPAFKAFPRCHWCGCRLNRHGYCDECGEQF